MTTRVALDVVSAMRSFSLHGSISKEARNQGVPVSYLRRAFCEAGLRQEMEAVLHQHR